MISTSVLTGLKFWKSFIKFYIIDNSYVLAFKYEIMILNSKLRQYIQQVKYTPKFENFLHFSVTQMKVLAFCIVCLFNSRYKTVLYLKFDVFDYKMKNYFIWEKKNAFYSFWYKSGKPYIKTLIPYPSPIQYNIYALLASVNQLYVP